MGQPHIHVAILISIFKINPFITTVGTGFIINGLSLVVTRNAAFIVSDPAFGILGAGRWHGSIIPLQQRYNTLFGDGHAKNINRDTLERLWAMPL